jgi:hypothetical protein
VNDSERADIGLARAVVIGGQSPQPVGEDQLHVGDKHTIVVGRWQSTDIGELYKLSVGDHTGTVMTKDGQLYISTGMASVRIDKEHIVLQANGKIHLRAGEGVHISTERGKIDIQGGPLVAINDKGNGGNPNVETVVAARPPPPPSPVLASLPPFRPAGGGTIGEPGAMKDVTVPGASR